jgi:integrase
MDTISIVKLAEQVRDAQLKLGLTGYTVWSIYSNSLLPVVKLHNQRGQEYLDHSIMDEYHRNIEERRKRGEIGFGYYNQLRRGAEQLVEMHDTGKLVWACCGFVSKYQLNEYYDPIIQEYTDSADWHPNTRKDIIWIAKKFFSWLINEGRETLENVNAVDVQQFMIHCSNHMRCSGLHNVRLYMKKLCRYLYERKYIPDSYESLLSFRINRESKLLPAASDDEIAAVLNTIDRRTLKGKRDYAMILLAIVTGLRAIDIVRLKLSDVDWRNGEIKIVQSKTGKSLALPLTKDVGEAMLDYILDGRQKTESDAVFLRHHAPHQAFKDAVCIGDMYDDYCRRAGIHREAYDGKGFHSLRRSVGKKLTTSGVHVTMTAQILGDADIDSVKKYISLDSAHLKGVALDFTGIEPEVMR